MDELKAVGLKTYECRIVEALLMGKHTLKELSKVAKVPPGKVYSVAKQLEERGLLKSTASRPKMLYIDNASGLVSKLTKDYDLRHQLTIASLNELATRVDKANKRETPFFEVGISVDDNKRIQGRVFIEAEKEVLQVLNIHHKPRSNRQSKSLWEGQVRQAVDRGVVFKAIYPFKADIPRTIREISKKNPSGFQIRRLDSNFARCDIVDEKKVLVKLVYEDPLQFGGVIFLEDRAFAKNLKSLFSRLWSEARPDR